MTLKRTLLGALLAAFLASGCIPTPEQQPPPDNQADAGDNEDPGDGSDAGDEEPGDEEKEPAKLILHQQSPPTMRTLVSNQAHIDSLPFDGTTFTIPASYEIQGTEPISVETLREQLADSSKVQMTNVTQHWVMVYAAPAGTVDDYQTVIDNFANLAQVAGELGLAGIFYDTEEYFGDTWSLEVLGPDRPAADVIADTRARGRETAAAMAKRWADTKIVVLLGPWIAERRSADPEFLGEACVDENGLIFDIAHANQGLGAFTLGLALGSLEAGTTFIDGAEMYTPRTLEDWRRAHAWVTEGFPTHSDMVPAEFKEAYATQVEIAQGTYDFPSEYRCKGPTGVEDWEIDVKHALMTSDSIAWAYTERFEWVGNLNSEKPALPAEWLEATRRAKAAGQAQ